MQLAIRFLGLELLTVVFSTETEEYEESEPGDCTSFPIGFVANYEKPDEVGLPDRWNY